MCPVTPPLEALVEDPALFRPTGKDPRFSAHKRQRYGQDILRGSEPLPWPGLAEDLQRRHLPRNAGLSPTGLSLEEAAQARGLGGNPVLPPGLADRTGEDIPVDDYVSESLKTQIIDRWLASVTGSLNPSCRNRLPVPVSQIAGHCGRGNAGRTWALKWTNGFKNPFENPAGSTGGISIGTSLVSL